MAPGAVTTNGTSLHTQLSKVVNSYRKEDQKTIQLVLSQFRCLIADLCQQFNGGHPG
jgi:dihydroxyacetone synthase